MPWQTGDGCTGADGQMAGLMNSPEFMQSMADMMSRPEIVEQVCGISSLYHKPRWHQLMPRQMIASNPQMAGMAPQIRQMMNNPMVRQMMSNPETLRMASLEINERTIQVFV